MSDPRAGRIAAIVGGVLRQALDDAGAAGLILLDDGGPEASLVAGWCEAVLGPERVQRASGGASEEERRWATCGRARWPP